jgi:iron complex outermembrane receptor protein
VKLWVTRPGFAAFPAFLLLTSGSPARGQAPIAPDTVAYSLSEVIVTADRVSAILGTQTAMVSRLSGETLRRQPIQRLTDGLQAVPGLVVLHAGTMGDQPRLIMRGFYGGGEAEYTAVLLDGVPLGSLASGVVSWDVIPLSAVREVEVVRGSASALYGDAAVGGVINIITRAHAPTPPRWRIAAGDYETVEGSGAWSGTVGTRAASLYGGRRHSDGYRAHEGGDALTLGGSIDLHRSSRASLALSSLYHYSDHDDPGPLPEILLADSPRASSPYFRFDRRGERMRRASLTGWTAIGETSRMSGYLTGERVTSDLTRTLQLAPEFADTRSRVTLARRLLGSMQLETRRLRTPWPQRLSLGTDLSLGRLSSDYRPVVMGGPAEYESPSQAGNIDVSGGGRRESAALFLHWEHRIAVPLRVIVGGRLDRLRDVYRATLPAALPRTSVTHRAFSPKIGLNFSYLETARHAGNVYVSTARSFKAPTLDQLFDQRPIPIPVEPFSVTVSNPELRPQRGAGVEAGITHRKATSAGHVLEMTLAAYRQHMKDELDFDVARFRYINVGRSLHKGIELGARLETRTGSNLFATLTRQDVLARNGPFAGRQLKAVPRQTATAGVTAALPLRLHGSLSISDVRAAFVDDANLRRLPGYTRVDSRVSATIASIRFSLDARNLLNRALVSTGFPDPSGTDVVYYHPDAGRVLLFGIMSIW